MLLLHLFPPITLTFLHIHTHTTERASCTSLLKQVKQKTNGGKAEVILRDYEERICYGRAVYDCMQAF